MNRSSNNKLLSSRYQYHMRGGCVLMKEGSFTAWLWANRERERESLGPIPATGNPSRLVSWTPMAKGVSNRQNDKICCCLSATALACQIPVSHFVCASLLTHLRWSFREKCRMRLGYQRRMGTFRPFWNTNLHYGWMDGWMDRRGSSSTDRVGGTCRASRDF
jgi:hypothetical protein